jgi:Bacterial extracellular solute-binding proteins, family 5 Middle
VYRYFMLAHRATLLVPLAFLLACAHPRIGVSPATGGGVEGPGDESCLLSTGAVAGHTATVTIGLSDSVDPGHAPFPRNDAERLVFRHLYERPVRIDCDGHPHAELADQWDKEDDGRRWTFRLRDDAQFWDGAPVTAQDIVFGKGGVGYTLSAPENRVVAVSFAKGQDDLPPVLGDPGLAVTKPAPDSSWPIGTGAYWATSGTTTAKEIRAHTTHGDTLVFKFASGDARDLLDAGVDLLVTRDRVLRDYAATLQNRAVIPLPWDRTYVYVTAEAGSTRFDGLEQSVRADARRAEGGFWWLDLKACGIGQGSSPPASTGQKRILYPRTDPTARELAGRLAALTHAAATGRAPDDFSAALSAGRDWGYIVALPRVTPDVCRTARDLLPSWSATFTALVDTRATAIARRGAARWVVDRDGTVHLAP